MEPLSAITDPTAFISVASGIGAVLYGLLRPATFLIIALVAYKTPNIHRGTRWLLVVGALGNFVTSLAFIFFGANEPVPVWLVDTAEIIAVPAQVMFTIGFAEAAIRLGGLEFGSNKRR